ncbi:SIN3-HDAC complex-associated factor [Onthophagus taurus]|uniref:SIN3-HDAC complex-associated factor n=1 Tax=Onthophagus taurus TaxID=166361 RepID=UPI000C20FC28|nr:protein FAM60A [Onthophagus taurus]
MFSFHRPKVYRSSTGCCICKAKSSSSRFTDSKKYESDFVECFQLSSPRQGEICNACVLLVKRYKKLPVGSDRNWRHVVDARAGPGMKSMTKFKSKHKKLSETGEKTVGRKKKHFEHEYSPVLSDNEADPNADTEMVEMDFMSESTPSGRSSPGGSDCDESVGAVSSSNNRRRKGDAKRRVQGDDPDISDFVDTNYWKRESICCGIIFRGEHGEILVDRRFLKACNARVQLCKLRPTQCKVETNEINDSSSKMYNSDNSSDSGYYDDSSNQGGSGSPRATDASRSPTEKREIPSAN